jgi:hypothetical protein
MTGVRRLRRDLPDRPAEALTRLEEVVPMTHPNVELIQRFFTAVMKMDREAIMACVTDDVIMHVPGDNPIAGTYKGIEQFAGTMRRVEETTGGLQRELHDVAASDDHVIALVELKATKSGHTWNGANIWHVRDGKLSEVWFLSEDQAVTDQAFS